MGACLVGMIVLIYFLGWGFLSRRRMGMWDKYCYQNIILMNMHDYTCMHRYALYS
jgi:hypothetical protein